MYQRRSASSFFIEWSKVYLVLLHLVCFLPVFSISGHRSRSECFVWWSLGKIKGFFFFFWATVSYPFCYQMIWCKEMLMHFGVIHCVNNVMILPVLELQFWQKIYFFCFSNLGWKAYFGYVSKVYSPLMLNVFQYLYCTEDWSLTKPSWTSVA